MFTKDAQPLEPLVMPLLQPTQSFITLTNGLQCILLWIVEINFIEGITHLFSFKLTGEHIRIDGQIGHTWFTIQGQAIGHGIDRRSIRSTDRSWRKHVTRQPNACTHSKQSEAK
jgi:hypothetical protein